jgi:hypothetical protein
LCGFLSVSVRGGVRATGRGGGTQHLKPCGIRNLARAQTNHGSSPRQTTQASPSACVSCVKPRMRPSGCIAAIAPWQSICLLRPLPWNTGCGMQASNRSPTVRVRRSSKRFSSSQTSAWNVIRQSGSCGSLRQPCHPWSDSYFPVMDVKAGTGC